MQTSRHLLAVPLVLVLTTAACAQTIPREALQLSEESLAQRRMQTRIFETRDENRLLAAVAALLQDLGFTLDESETELGVVVASKHRDAREAGQATGAFLVLLLTAALGSPSMPAIDDKQKMRASVVTRPIGDYGSRTAVRVTFQRIVWNTEGRISKIEGLTDPEAYQEFFDKLSKAVFLEAHAL